MQEGVIGVSATLNVFESKPDVPLEPFSMDNVVLSAHRAVATLMLLSICDVIELVVGSRAARNCSVRQSRLKAFPTPL